MADALTESLRPVFLEPRDEYWEIHDPENLSLAQQRTYRLTPHGTAQQLKNAVYCENCFPGKRSDD